MGLNPTKGKISMRQIFIMFFLMTASAMIRSLPLHTAKYAREGSWVVPIITVIPFLILLYVFYKLFRRYEDKSLDEVYDRVFTKYISKVILFINLIWILLLIAYYVRYFGESIVSSILPHMHVQFFIIVILTISFFVVRGSIESFARVSEIFFLMFLIVFSFITVMSVSNIKLINLYPVTIDHALPIVKSSYPIIGIWSYITILMFLGNKIVDKDNIKFVGKKFSILLLIVNITIIAITIGQFGYLLTSNFSFPFYMVFKNINFLNVIQRMESIFVAFWIIVDFALVTSMLFSFEELGKKIFKVKERKSYINSSNVCDIYIIPIYWS